MVFIALLFVTLTAFVPFPLAGQSEPGETEAVTPPYACISSRVPSRGTWERGRIKGTADGGFKFDSACGVTVAMFRPGRPIITRSNFTPNSTAYYPEVDIRLYTVVGEDGETTPRWSFTTKGNNSAAWMMIYTWPIPVVN
jgi:hypothetical protein